MSKKIRARVTPAPTHFRAMPELKSFFSLDVFPIVEKSVERVGRKIGEKIGEKSMKNQ